MTARNVPDLTGELYRAQQRIDALQRFALFGLVGAIVLIVLICL
jgi:putative flippase GtrA